MTRKEVICHYHCQVGRAHNAAAGDVESRPIRLLNDRLRSSTIPSRQSASSASLHFSVPRKTVVLTTRRNTIRRRATVAVRRRMCRVGLTLTARKYHAFFVRHTTTYGPLFFLQLSDLSHVQLSFSQFHFRLYHGLGRISKACWMSLLMPNKSGFPEGMQQIFIKCMHDFLRRRGQY